MVKRKATQATKATKAKTKCSLACPTIITIERWGHKKSHSEVWEGDFRRSFPVNSSGKRTFSNTDRAYEGEFKDGELHGQGKVFYPLGCTKEGKFQNGELNGPGKITWNSGSIWEGCFKDGRMCGKGKITDKHTISEGEFEHNELDGPGKIIHPYALPLASPEDDVDRDDLLSRPGTQIFTDGDTVEGCFTDLISPQPHHNCWNGYIVKCGWIEEGCFKSGELEQGKQTFVNGDTVEGKFKDGELHGPGKQIFANGNIVEGVFKDGELHV